MLFGWQSELWWLLFEYYCIVCYNQIYLYYFIPMSEFTDDMKYIIDLEAENKKLKSDLSECECSLWFENDEVLFWKREYKRLKQRIKDHCKWYWNLFPEDEMKRQRKKAEKKKKKEEIRVSRDEHSYDEIWGE